MFFPEDFHILKITAFNPTGKLLCLEEISIQHVLYLKQQKSPNSNQSGCSKTQT